MATICMSTYIGDLLCPSPGGLPKVATIDNDAYDVHGWILRDDSTREIITVFRGTESIQNYESDTNYTLADFATFPSCVGCQVHGGYYLLWEAVVSDVQSLIQEQASQYPDYGIVITGHRYSSSKIFPNKNILTMTIVSEAPSPPSQQHNIPPSSRILQSIPSANHAPATPPSHLLSTTPSPRPAPTRRASSVPRMQTMGFHSRRRRIWGMCIMGWNTGIQTQRGRRRRTFVEQRRRTVVGARMGVASMRRI